MRHCVNDVRKGRQFLRRQMYRPAIPTAPKCGFGRISVLERRYDGQEAPMLHTKFCENRPAGSGEEDFRRVFTIYGRGGHLGHVTSIMLSDFHFFVPESFHTKFNSEWPSSF